MHSDVPRAVFFYQSLQSYPSLDFRLGLLAKPLKLCSKPNRNFSHFQVSLSVKIVGNMILIASSIIVNYLFLPALPFNSVKLASSRQMPNSRTRKAGVTGSSPVAGSITQDSRLRAAFLLPISDAHPPIQAQRRRQLPYSAKSPANRGLPNGKPRSVGPSALLNGITPSDEQLNRAVRYSSQ